MNGGVVAHVCVVVVRKGGGTTDSLSNRIKSKDCFFACYYRPLHIPAPFPPPRTCTRLVTRASIEERMMQTSRKKIILEHLVVRKLGTGGGGAGGAGGREGAAGGSADVKLKQSELDDILRWALMTDVSCL